MSLGEKIGTAVVLVVVSIVGVSIYQSATLKHKPEPAGEPGTVYLLRSVFTPGETNLVATNFSTITHTFGVRGTNGQVYEFMNLRNHIAP